MNKELLRAGFYFDALEIHPKATKKEILYGIMNFEREYSRDQEILDLLKKARDYLIRQEKEYKEWMLPCLDYILILIANKYGPDIKDGIANHGFLKIETIEKQFEQASEQVKEDSLERIFSKALKSIGQDKLSSLESLPLSDDASKIGFVESILELGDEDNDYLYFDGECDNTIPSRKRAVEVALEVFQNLPQDPSLLGSLGFSLIKLGDYQKALTCFHRQSEKSDENGIIWNNIAWCQMRLGNHEDALVACEQALKYLSDHSHVHHDHAAILMWIGRWDEAIKVIENAISNIKPEAIQLYYLLPSVLERKGDIQSAIFHWKQYIKLASGKVGHEKAVLRVQEKLREKGFGLSDMHEPSSMKRIPLRKISEDIFDEIVANIQQAVHIVKKNNVNPDRVLTEDEINQEAEKIFHEAFGLLKGIPRIDSDAIGRIKDDLLKEQRNKNIPFYILIKDALYPLIKKIFKDLL